MKTKLTIPADFPVTVIPEVPSAHFRGSEVSLDGNHWESESRRGLDPAYLADPRGEIKTQEELKEEYREQFLAALERAIVTDLVNFVLNHLAPAKAAMYILSEKHRWSHRQIARVTGYSHEAIRRQIPKIHAFLEDGLERLEHEQSVTGDLAGFEVHEEISFLRLTEDELVRIIWAFRLQGERNRHQNAGRPARASARARAAICHTEGQEDQITLF